MEKLSAYAAGVEKALVDLGLVKTAALPTGLLSRAAKFWKASPVAQKAMMQAGAGGLAGLAAGSAVSDKGNWAAPIMGGLVGAAGGAALSPAVRAKLMSMAGMEAKATKQVAQAGKRIRKVPAKAPVKSPPAKITEDGLGRPWNPEAIPVKSDNLGKPWAPPPELLGKAPVNTLGQPWLPPEHLLGKLPINPDAQLLRNRLLAQSHYR